MKKVFALLITGFGLAIAAQAQPTITWSWAPVAGDTITSQHAKMHSSLPGNSGDNVTWDFSSLVDSGGTNVTRYVAPGSTPYATDFLGADVALEIGAGTYEFYDVSSTAMTDMGMGSAGMTIQLTDPFDFFRFPMTYNSAYSDQFSGTYMLGGIINVTRTGTFNSNANAWGKLMLPGGKTYNDVLRVYMTQNTVDSTDLGDVTVSTMESYMWITQSTKQILMDYHIIHDGTDETRYVRYNPNIPTGIKEPVTAKAGQFYPNPARDVINIPAGNGNERNISIFDLNGRLVSAWTLDGNAQTLSVEGIPNGAYLLNINGSNTLLQILH